MSKWRITVVAGLLLLPVLFLLGVGAYFLWESHWGLYAWWPMAGSAALGYLLAWYWQRRRRLIGSADAEPSLHWTDRDRQAWRIVQERAKAAAQVTLEQLGDIQSYVDTARSLSVELGRFYHPGAEDPLGALTIPEILAVVELAAHDLADMVDQSLPAGHLLTINDWRWARQAAEQATKWYQKSSTVYWLVSAFFAPVETAAKFTAAKVGMGRPWDLLQQNLVAWFFTAYVHRLGTYLIELNSGRLRVGAERYRELKEAATARQRDGKSERQGDAGIAPSGKPGAATDEPVPSVTITILGQVKAGKSSLINALLGAQRAATDVLPATDEVTRYELHPPGDSSRLVLLDTVGYAHAGPKEDQLRITRECARQSDLVILVLHARNPARQADLELLQGLRAWFASRLDLKAPPVVGVATHIDLLSPAMEWSPPYDWQQPRRPKEEQIAQAVAAIREQLGDFLVAVVPVCTASDRVHGVQEWLLPVLAERLDEAHAVALLRCLRIEIGAGKVRKVFSQLLSAGKHVAAAMRKPSRR